MKDATPRETSSLPAFVSHATFDEYADDYERAVSKGVRLSGESADYFAEKRIQYTALWLRVLGLSAPWRVADFGCGVGNSTPYLRRYFPQARLLGLDVSAASIKRARQVHGDVSQFLLVNEVGDGDNDLVYSHGVFHHIA